MNEIKTMQYLLSETGAAEANGYSKLPHIIFDKDYCRIPRIKLNERDSYYISNNEVGFYISVLNYGVNTYASVALIDFLDGNIYSCNVLKPLTFGQEYMPTRSDSGSVSYADSRVSINFSCTSIKRYIKCDFVNFCQDKNLFANLTLEQKFADSLNAATPASDTHESYFYLSRFLPELSVTGTIRFGGQEYSFDNTNANGYLNWQRYGSPDKKFATTLFCDTQINRKPFSLLLSSPGQENENSFFYNGTMFKLEKAQFVGNENFLNRPFRISTTGRMVDLVFRPKIRNGHLMSVDCDKRTMVFGNISGKLRHEETGRLEIINLPAHLEFYFV
ncbi:MAG: DUF2804 domain-containing protein [Oscillospiraceae bacterium]|jgi:hypothetical protein|nr:DUF2804 domain-containing protein [Oscillospiraceae bacterium]